MSEQQMTREELPDVMSPIDVKSFFRYWKETNLRNDGKTTFSLSEGRKAT